MSEEVCDRRAANQEKQKTICGIGHPGKGLKIVIASPTWYISKDILIGT